MTNLVTAQPESDSGGILETPLKPQDYFATILRRVSAYLVLSMTAHYKT